MIPVAPQPEPAGFDSKVRQKGQEWLRSRGLDGTARAPAEVVLEPFWRACLPELHAAYSGVCAYLCIYLELVTGANTVDHFVAKSQAMGLAYEWSNYRLACSRMNSRKGAFEDVLDPFVIAHEMFYLELVSGAIYPNPSLDTASRRKAKATIDRLELDDYVCREMRARRFDDYRKGDVSAAYLGRCSPFVYSEAERQGLL